VLCLFYDQFMSAEIKSHRQSHIRYGNVPWEVRHVDIGGQRWFSGDDLINAYFLGKAEQKDNDRRAMLILTERNINEAKLACEKIFESLVDSGAHVYAVFLRPASMVLFDALFLLSVDDLIGDRGEKTYAIALPMAESVCQEGLTLDVSMMAKTPNTDFTTIQSDGYILRYQPDRT